MSASDSTGWWTFQPAGPVMVHGVSGEQIAYTGTLADDGLPELSERASWHRFEYRHTDLIYPLYVRITDAQGPKLPWTLEDTEPHRVWMVDFERTAMTEDGFRGETAREPLPFGMWVRVREAVEDAFRCWPTADPLGRHADRIILKGGWFGDWSPGIARLSAHRNNLFNRFDSRLLDDLPTDFVGHNTVPLDTRPIRFWEVYREQHGISNPTIELAQLNAPSGFFASFDKKSTLPEAYFPGSGEQPDRIISCSFSRITTSQHSLEIRPPAYSSASLIDGIGFHVGQAYIDRFGHKSRDVKVGGIGPRAFRPPNGVGCPTEIFASDPDDNELIAANCFTSAIYSSLDQPYEPFDAVWKYRRYDKYPRFDKWRLGRECLEALSGANRGHLLYDGYFATGEAFTLNNPRKALMAGGGYVGGDLSFEPYCLTFIYTDKKPAGMAWIAHKNPHVTEFASKLADIYDIS